MKYYYRIVKIGITNMERFRVEFRKWYSLFWIKNNSWNTLNQAKESVRKMKEIDKEYEKIVWKDKLWKKRDEIKNGLKKTYPTDKCPKCGKQKTKEATTCYECYLNGLKKSG